MKKYKLIKEYPGSPKVGDIVKGYGRDSWSEYWEEVVEKDYEILSYLKKGSTTCTTTKRRGGENHKEFWDIYSVKRLSDGEVFTLGDKIKVYQHGSIKTIDSIDLYGNTSSIKEGIWFSYNTGSCHMTHIIKQKPQPIYLTHDGKDIFPEDIVWYVNKENFYHDYIKAYPEVKFNSEIRAYFLTEEAAQEYVLLNKPSISINELWEISSMCMSNTAVTRVLEELVKKRLNLK